MGLLDKFDQMPWWVALFMAFAAWATYFLGFPLWKRHRSNAAVLNSNYQKRLLSVARAHQEAVRARLAAAHARLKAGDLDRMVDGMSLERINCPSLINADQDRLSLVQINLLEKYRFRENELDVFVNELGARGYSKEKSVSSFMHRLRKLSEATDDLVKDWNNANIEP